MPAQQMMPMAMMASRRITGTTARATVRTMRPTFRAGHRRTFADSASTQATQTASNHTPAIVGGLVGGAFVFLAGYGYYHVSGAKSFVNTLHQVKSKFDAAGKTVADSTIKPNEALQWLRETATSYATFVPGGKYYIGKAFDDLDAVHAKHGGEVDEIVQETYKSLKAATAKKGMSLDTASEAMGILGDAMNRIMALAGDALEDILENHPQLKSQVGGSLSQLKSMGENLGPEAKKQVDATWSQVQEIVGKGVGVSTIPQIKKLVEEKTQQLRQLGDKAWDKGLEQAKPYLDKVPQAKELIEKNKDALMQGDVGTLLQKLKDAATSGSSDDLRKYVDEAIGKAKEGGKQAVQGSGLEKYLSLIPGGSDIAGTLQKLADVGQKHGKEAESLLGDTIKELKQVLEGKLKDAEKLAESAKKESSS